MTYSIINGAFQASNSFTNVAAGNQTVVVKDGNGYTQSKAVMVNAAAAGPLFTTVRSILQANCVICHNSSVQNGGMNWGRGL